MATSSVPSRIVLECCERVLENPESATLMELLWGTSCFDPEFDAVSKYVLAFDNVDEYCSIKFMYACFTLLLNDDDNF